MSAGCCKSRASIRRSSAPIPFEAPAGPVKKRMDSLDERRAPVSETGRATGEGDMRNESKRVGSKASVESYKQLLL